MSTKNNEEMRRKLTLRADSKEVLKELEKDKMNPDLWYKLGMAVTEEDGRESGIDVYSQGLVHNPFNASLYFARGRNNIGLRRFWRSVSDATMAINLQPEIWSHWYYRAVAYNLNGNFKESMDDFMHCLDMTEAEEQYPIIDWIFLTALDMDDREKAKEVLDYIDTDIVPPAMDYAYRRRVMLYKGIIKAENFIDLEDIKENTLQLPGRVQLEINTLTFGLYAYHAYKRNYDKANEILVEISEFEPSAAFGYIKGINLAKKNGLID